MNIDGFMGDLDIQFYENLRNMIYIANRTEIK